jgi:hypothetical protein
LREDVRATPTDGPFRGGESGLGAKNTRIRAYAILRLRGFRHLRAAPASSGRGYRLRRRWRGNGHFADGWQLNLAQRTSLQIDLTSDTFDAMFVVTDAIGSVIEQDDDGADGTHSRLQIILNAGAYTLWRPASPPL